MALGQEDQCPAIQCPSSIAFHNVAASEPYQDGFADRVRHQPSIAGHPIYVVPVELKMTAPRFDDLFVLFVTVKEAETDGLVNIKPSRHRSLPI